MQQLRQRRARGNGCSVRWLALATVLLVQCSHSEASTQALIQSVTSVWEDVLQSAAKESLKAITKQLGQSRSLEAVPLDSLKVFIGRQHHLAVDVAGTTYEVTLGAEADAQDLAAPQHSHRTSRAATLQAQVFGKAKAAAAGLQVPTGVGSGLVPHDFWSSREHKLSLPELVLTGPIELVLAEPQPVSMFLPHAADVGIVRRVLLQPGATIKVSHMNAITLRRPVDLPNLPGQYLAEVYAHAKLGEPEAGYHYAPGVLFMSKRLREAATNSSRKGGPLLSFEVEPASFGALSLSAEGEHTDDDAPRLKIKRASDGTVEVSVRPGQVAQPKLSMNSLTHVWAWPLPHLDMSSWLPYESMLRGLLASHPFNIKDVMKSGIPLRLTKSSIKGVSLMAFDIHLRARLELEGVPEDSPFPKEENPLEVWQVVVQVNEERPGRGSVASSDRKSRFKYTPMSIQRKQVFGNTLTVADRTAEAFNGNSSVPLGFESHDFGVARYAP